MRDSNLTKEEREQQEELERLEMEAALIEAQAAAGTKAGKKGGKKQAAAAVVQEEEHRRLYATGSQAYVVFLEEQELNKALVMKRKKRSWINSGAEASPADLAKLTGLGVSSKDLLLFSQLDLAFTTWGDLPPKRCHSEN